MQIDWQGVRTARLEKSPALGGRAKVEHFTVLSHGASGDVDPLAAQEFDDLLIGMRLARVLPGDEVANLALYAF